MEASDQETESINIRNFNLTANSTSMRFCTQRERLRTRWMWCAIPISHSTKNGQFWRHGLPMLARWRPHQIFALPLRAALSGGTTSWMRCERSIVRLIAMAGHFLITSECLPRKEPVCSE